MTPIALHNDVSAPLPLKPTATTPALNSAYPDGLLKWSSPAETAEPLAWAELETIDLGLLDDPSARADLIKRVSHGLRVDGFLFVTGTGVSSDTLARQLAIAQRAISIEREEKERYAARLQEGSYEGYKLRGIWTKEGGVQDNIEHFNLESNSFQDPAKHIPPTLQPYLDEIRGFAEHTYKSIVYRILKLVSLALELPEDYLWELHEQSGAIGHACQRYMGYFPRNDADDKATEGIWSKGHTDYNSISLLFSQPVSALQILTPQNEWRWVKHVEGAVVVNTADALEFLTGGVFKATRHRVIRPPPDQANIIRYILIHFARVKRSLELNPLWDSPVVKAEGRNSFQDRIDKGGKAPTQDEWLQERIRRTGNELYDHNKRQQNGRVEEEILGRKVEYYV